MRKIAAVFSLVLAVGCSASAGPEEAGAEALSGGSSSILVPVAGAEKAVAAACGAELDATYCSAASARAASASCVAKLSADTSAQCGGACVVAYSPVRASCHAGATYPTRASCDAPVADDCSFYRACLEASQPCGDQGYALDFGERLCYAFVEEHGRFTPHGQSWLRRIRTCLQTSIVPTLHEGLACGALEDAAYAAHSPCYTQKGDSICHLPIRDVASIARILGTTLVSSRGLAQIREIAAACLFEGLGILSAAPPSRAFFQGLANAAEDESTLRAFLDQTDR